MNVADKEQLAILKQGVQVWNKWREEHPEVIINLTKANLMRANLSGANLAGADLRKADLRKADLRYADLAGADLREADLNFQELEQMGRPMIADYARKCWTDHVDHDPGMSILDLADLTGAVLREAKVAGADLTGANLTGIDLGSVMGLTCEQVESAVGKPMELPDYIPDSCKPKPVPQGENDTEESG
jgi:hypothetical protein